MSDPLQHVAPGDPLIFRADTFNLLLDAAQFTRRRQRGPIGTPKGNAIFPPLVPATLAYGKNTGSTIVSHSAVSPTGVTPISPIDNPLNARAQPVFVVAPSTADDEIVFITQEPIQGGSSSPLGRIATSGVTVAYIDVSDADHEFARVDAEGNLVSATSGPLRILGPFETGAGGRLVLIGAGTSSATDGDGTGGGICANARIKSTDCVILRDGGDDVILRGGGPWTGTNGRGDWVYGYDAAIGFDYLSLDGVRLMNCGNGCFTGSEFTGNLMYDSESLSCEGPAFTVCIACRCCPFDEWDGVPNKWYCMEIDEECTPVLIVGDGDECEDWVYCSGPYDTEEEAAAVCPGGAGSFTPCSDDYPPFGDPAYTDPVNLSAPDPGCSKSLLWASDGIWSTTGCSGATVTLYCDSGVWKLTTSATDLSCVGGAPQIFSGTSGSLLAGTLTFMVPRCLMQSSGGDATMVPVTFSY